MKVVNIVVNNIDPLAALQMVVEERGLLKKNGYKGIFDAFLCRCAAFCWFIRLSKSSSG